MLDQARRLLEDLGEPQEFESTFRLGVTELIAMTWLADLSQALRCAYPRLRLEVEVRNRCVILDEMNRGKYDVALLLGSLWGRIVDAVPLRTLERAWMASPKMGIPRHVLSVEELSEYPIASQFPDNIHAQLQSAWFTRAGFPLRNLVQADGFAVLGEMARTGIAVAQLPVGYYTPELKRKQLVRLKVEPELPDVEYFAIYRRAIGHALAGAVANIAKEHCNFAATSTIQSVEQRYAQKPVR
ncbi:substrate-binding domain-containing protein [Acidovorax sp. CCYZU-2555]|uniref:substrate-binding domain-containing protein n=1 Tax=Acidovorax sp. CCYZU-2555 TaxID=2835042 RepID=UPI001BCB7C94|nr:substrate-binding domain-containing protein [Acidovorax sp. CCYZU-2555]MBS7776809.1 substrate-binding domain-containing protein [Acidovorax sp. CCYZU-2555]